MADGFDVNDGPCVMCGAAQGVACTDRCPEAVGHEDRAVLRARIAELEKKLEAAEKLAARNCTFFMDAEQLAQADAWLSEHRKTCRVWKPGAYHGAIGGALTYSFTGTSIGVICTIECACGEKGDCTGDL